METTIAIIAIILIIAVLFETGTNIYIHFVDKNANKQSATTLSMMDQAMKKYVENERNLNDAIKRRDDSIFEWQKSYNELVKSHNMIGKYLPNAIQKEAMRKFVDGEADDHDKETVKEYIEWIKTLKYEDTKN